MPAQVLVVKMYDKVSDLGGMVINTTSKAAGAWETDLSPFHLGPCKLYGRNGEAANMENLWQFSKVYKTHTFSDGDPTQEYWDWAYKGWVDPAPHRYPMGKGKRPEYSLWNGEHLGYIDARKKIYAPAYAKAVQERPAWGFLQWLYKKCDLLILRDFDGYKHQDLNMSLTDVLNNPGKKMGHAFVLAMLLKKDRALKQIDI